MDDEVVSLRDLRRVLRVLAQEGDDLVSARAVEQAAWTAAADRRPQRRATMARRLALLGFVATLAVVLVLGGYGGIHAISL